MKNLTDREIQELLEKGGTPSDQTNDDEKTYRLLFETLKKEPAESLSYNFSAKVAAQIRLQHDLKPSFKPYLVIILSVSTLLASAYFILPMLQLQYLNSYLPSVFEYKWLMLFAVLCFTLIKYFDQRLRYTKLLN